MTTLIKLHPNSTYTPEQVERGLTALAMFSGNVRRTHKFLHDEGVIEPGANTIKKWRDRHTERYAEIRATVAPKLKAALADTHTSLAQSLAELEGKTIELLDVSLEDLEAREHINLLKNTAIAGAIHVDKAQLLRGEATQIHGRSFDEVRRALEAKGITIEGSAVEVDKAGKPVDEPADPAVTPPEESGKRSPD